MDDKYLKDISDSAERYQTPDKTNQKPMHNYSRLSPGIPDPELEKKESDRAIKLNTENGEEPATSQKNLAKLHLKSQPLKLGSSVNKRLKRTFLDIPSVSEPLQLRSHKSSLADPAVSMPTIPILVTVLQKPPVRELLVNPNTFALLDEPKTEQMPPVSDEGRAKPKEFGDDSGTKLKDHDPFEDSGWKLDKLSSGLRDVPGPKDTYLKVPSSRVGNILSPKLQSSSVFINETDRTSVLNSYLPTALYLAMKLDLQEAAPLHTQLVGFKPSLERISLRQLPESRVFLKNLLASVLKNEEVLVFQDLLDGSAHLDKLLDTEIFEVFAIEGRFDYLLSLYQTLLKRMKQGKVKIPTTQEELDTVAELLIRWYLPCAAPYKDLLDLLNTMGLDLKKIISTFINIGEEQGLIRACTENEELVKLLSVEELINQERLAVLVVYDPAALIPIFNSETINPEVTVYQALCNRVMDGDQVELHCNVVIHVHRTFWDMEKLPKFFIALSKLMLEVRSDGSQNDWLSQLDQPLLYVIKMVKFLQKMKLQLDFKDKQMNKLLDNLLRFCVSFCKTAPEEILGVVLFTQDSKKLDFLEYAFAVESMEVINLEYVEKTIRTMWNLNRHTMQTISQFMRLNFMESLIRQIDWKIFTRRYHMPVEDGDNFSMQFCFTSSSLLLRVLTDVFWTGLLIAIEIIFSLRVIELYKRDAMDSEWLSRYYNENPIFSLVHIYLRCAYILSSVVRLVLLNTYNRKGLSLQEFITTVNVLLVAQMGGYTTLLASHPWVMINSQMFVVLLLVGYGFYISLSIDDIGVVLRIFARMVYVVLIFAFVSIFIMIFIAFALHCIYIDFSQVVDGTDLNFYNDMYRGVLTLFEFLFGSVVLVRSYIEDNAYTYSLTAFMMIFSFFSNIMMANMLVAFLSKQFEEITRKAKYFTLRMQFDLSKLHRMEGNDGVFSLPYPLAPPLLPLILLSLVPSLKKKLNKFFRALFHVINIAFPVWLGYSVYLLLLIPVRYLSIGIRSLVVSIPSPSKFPVLVAWLVVGIPFLLWVFVQDQITIASVLLEFTTPETELGNASLSEMSCKQLMASYTQIFRTCFLVKGPPTVEKFLTLLKIKEDQESEEEEQEEQDDRFTSDINREYQQPTQLLIPKLLRRYCFKGRNEVDTQLFQSKAKHLLNPGGLPYLLGYDKNTLSESSKTLVEEEDNEKLRNHRLEEKVQNIDRQVMDIKRMVDDYVDSRF